MEIFILFGPFLLFFLCAELCLPLNLGFIASLGRDTGEVVLSNVLADKTDSSDNGGRAHTSWYTGNCHAASHSVDRAG